MALDIKTSNLITVCGQRGTGKTEFARLLMHTMRSDTNPVGVLDPLDQYKDVEESGKLWRVVPEPNKEIEAFGGMCQKMFDAGNGTLFGEEAEMYVPQKGAMDDRTKRCILRGRNRGVGMALITRRIAELDKTFFSLSDHVFIFQHFSPNDIDYLSDFLGKDEARALTTLAPFHFLHYSNGKIEMMKPITMIGKGTNPA